MILEGQVSEADRGAVVLASYPTTCRSGAISSPRHHHRRYAIAVAEETQKSQPDFKPTRNRGNVGLIGLISATFSARGRDARYHRRLPLWPAAL